MTTHLRPPHAAEILSLFLASQNLIGHCASPALSLLARPCIMAVKSRKRNE